MGILNILLKFSLKIGGLTSVLVWEEGVIEVLPSDNKMILANHRLVTFVMKIFNSFCLLENV